MKARRSYSQYCGLATALDIVGERWCALIIRDLAVSPRRFTDLLEGQKGLGTSLLAERLHHLEGVDLIERVTLERAAGGGFAYQLTPDGYRVAEALVPLAMWGATRVEGPKNSFRPDWLMFILKAAFPSEAAKGINDCYQFTIDGQPIWVRVVNQRIEVLTDEPHPPNFRATMSLQTFAGIGAGLIDPFEAAAQGAAKYQGDPATGLRALALLVAPEANRHRAPDSIVRSSAPNGHIG